MSQILSQALEAAASFISLLDPEEFGGKVDRPTAYLPKFNSVLIAEPEKNRIGIYNAKTLEFQVWLKHPNNTRGNSFEFPNCFYMMKNGLFIILEKSQLNILNQDFFPYQKPILGSFCGLSEGPKGDILTCLLGYHRSVLKRVKLKEEKYDA